MSFARVKLSVLLTVLAFLIFGCDSSVGTGILPVIPTPSTGVTLTGATVSGAEKIEATASTELTATVMHVGDGYDATKVAYAWSIVKSDDEEASSSDYATITPNATDPAKATIQATNTTTTAHTVTVKVVATYDNNVDITAQATHVITIAAVGEVVEVKSIESLKIEGSHAISWNAKTTLTATAVTKGNPDLTYAWSMAENTALATLSDSTTNTVELTANNSTTSPITVKILVTATDKTNSSVTKTSEEFSVEITAYGTEVEDKVTAVAISAEKTAIDTIGTTVLTASATKTGNPTVTYEWAIAEGGDYATLSATSGESVTLTGKNSTATAQTVKVSVSAKYTDKNGTEQTVPVAAPTEITVAEKTLTKIELTGTYKKEYFVGDAFSSDGMVITAFYSDNTTAPVATDKVTFSGNTTAAAVESQKVTVTYTDAFGSKEATYNIVVKADTVKSISAVLADTSKAWTEGDAFSAADVKVTAAYESGKTAELASTAYTVSPTTLAKDTEKITVTLAADSTIKAQVEISVKEKEKKAITSLTISGSHAIACDATVTLTATATVTGGADLTYSWNIKEDTTAATLSASTSNTVELTAKNTSTESAATVTVIVTAVDKTDASVTKTSEEFVITIEKKGVAVKDEVTAVAITGTTAIGTIGTTVLTASATKTGNPVVTYEWAIAEGGDYATLSATSGESVTLTGKNTTKNAQTVKVTVTAKYTVDGAEKTVSPDEPTEVTVAAKKLERIAIASEPTKKTYFVGEAFSADGLKVNAFYSDAPETAVDVTAKVALSGNTTSAVADSQTVTVTYTDDFGTDTASFTIAVSQDSITGIEAVLADETKKWFEGNAFAASDVTVKTVYASGKKTSVTDGYTVSPTTLELATTKITVTHTASGKTAEVAITVAARTLTKIQVTAQPTKTTYYVGEAFDAAGLVVTATYSDGTTANVTENVTFSGNTTAAVADLQTVTVSYSGQTATFTIKVLADTIARITAVLADGTKKWTVGDAFAASDVKVTAVYASGKTTELASTTYTVSPTTLAADTTKITVTHTDTQNTAEVAISVRVPVTGVELNKATLSLNRWKTENLTATVSPANATNKVVTWKSSDEKVATVTDGKVTTWAAGTATITVTTDDGAKTATCTLTVNPVYVSTGKFNLSTSAVSGYTVDGVADGKWDGYTGTDGKGNQSHDNIFITSKIDSNGANLYSDEKKGMMTFSLSKMMKVTFAAKGGNFGNVGKITTTNGTISQVSSASADNATVAAGGLSATIGDTVSKSAVLYLKAGDYIVLGNTASACKMQTITFEEVAPNTGVSVETGWLNGGFSVKKDAEKANTINLVLPDGLTVADDDIEWLVFGESSNVIGKTFTLCDEVKIYQVDENGNLGNEKPLALVKGAAYTITAGILVDGIIYDAGSLTIIYQ